MTVNTNIAHVTAVAEEAAKRPPTILDISPGA